MRHFYRRTVFLYVPGLLLYWLLLFFSPQPHPTIYLFGIALCLVLLFDFTRTNEQQLDN